MQDLTNVTIYMCVCMYVCIESGECSMESTNAQAPEPNGRAVLHGLASSPMHKPSPSSASPSLMATSGCPSDMGLHIHFVVHQLSHGPIFGLRRH